MTKDAKASVQEYRSRLLTYQAYASRLEALLTDLVGASGIRLHFVESRAKTPESLADKLRRPGKVYSDPLSEVPDLVGVRLILYYQDDVARVGAIIREQFTLIEEETAHQPEKYSPDQFGYLSMHYVVDLSKSRSLLPEWKPFTGIKAEIQVRTLLQHSWAAVSHALQYKREGDVPLTLRRKLFRLAGLFELADEEFVGIRRARDAVVAESAHAVRTETKSVRVDAPVIKEVIETSTALATIVKTMEDIGYEVKSEGDFVGEVVEECERLGILTLADLDMLLAVNPRAFLEKVFGGGWEVSKSFAIYLLLIAAHSDEFTEDYLAGKGWSRQIAERVVASAREDETA